MSHSGEQSPFSQSTTPDTTALVRNTLVEVRPAGEMGNGLFAVRDIRRGTRIIEETALIALLATRSMYDELDAFISSFRQLTEADKNVFDELYYNPSDIIPELRSVVRQWRRDNVPTDTDGGVLDGTRRIDLSKIIDERLAIFRGNCVPIHIGDMFGNGVFALFSRINHSCIPNAHWAYNTAIRRLTVHATSHIRVGQQITISYVKDPTATKEVRMSLLAPWRFVCSCAACTDPAMEARNQRIQELKQLLPTYDTTNGALEGYGIPAPVIVEALPAAMELVALLEMQGITGPELAIAYQECEKHSSRIGSFQAAANYAALGELIFRYAFGFDRLEHDGNGTEDGLGQVQRDV
ncbi:hypothetical protein MY11210_008732 [Beauveria gryllotalpidicola]